jgi:cell wall-associated NlpC family hydrolase
LCCVLLLAQATGCAGLKPKPDEHALAAAQQQRNRMLSTMKSYLGVRYHLGGESRRGMDCSGFTLKVYAAAGITLPRTAAQQFETGRNVDRKDLQFGDLLFFNTKRLANTSCACLVGMVKPNSDMPLVYGVTHTGIYVGDGRFMHASPSSGVSYARLEDDYWRPRFLGARRHLLDLPEDDP